MAAGGAQRRQRLALGVSGLGSFAEKGTSGLALDRCIGVHRPQAGGRVGISAAVEAGALGGPGHPETGGRAGIWSQYLLETLCPGSSSDAESPLVAWPGGARHWVLADSPGPPWRWAVEEQGKPHGGPMTQVHLLLGLCPPPLRTHWLPPNREPLGTC